MANRLALQNEAPPGSGLHVPTYRLPRLSAAEPSCLRETVLPVSTGESSTR